MWCGVGAEQSAGLCVATRRVCGSPLLPVARWEDKPELGTQTGIRCLMNPCMITWPALVPTLDDASPDASSEIPKKAAAPRGCDGPILFPVATSAVFDRLY